MAQSCPSGKIRRKAYTRKDGTRVKSTCIPDKGKPGKTPARKKVLPVPTKGSLGKYGYHDVKNKKAATRRKALTRAVKDAGYATIVRRVNLIANYNKLSDPRVHKIMRSDIAWMQKNLASKYSKTAARKASQTTGTKKLIKAGKKTIGGRERQLYRLSGSTSKFYRYRKKDGKMARRYL